MASDVIFTESLDALATAVEHVGAAAENERRNPAAESDGLRARQLYAAAGAAGLLLLVVLLLVPVPEADVDVLTAMRALTESAAPSSTPDRDAGQAASRGRRPGRRLQRAADFSRRPRSHGRAETVPGVNLAAASRVCADLARVTTPATSPRC